MILDTMTDRQRSKLIAVKPQSIHPGDAHLAITLIRQGGFFPEYAVHTYDGDDNSFSSGDYSDNLTDAMKAFNGRGVIV